MVVGEVRILPPKGSQIPAYKFSSSALQIKRARNLRRGRWWTELRDFIACNVLDIEAVLVDFPSSLETAY